MTPHTGTRTEKDADCLHLRAPLRFRLGWADPHPEVPYLRRSFLFSSFSFVHAPSAATRTGRFVSMATPVRDVIRFIDRDDDVATRPTRSPLLAFFLFFFAWDDFAFWFIFVPSLGTQRSSIFSLALIGRSSKRFCPVGVGGIAPPCYPFPGDSIVFLSFF